MDENLALSREAVNSLLSSSHDAVDVVTELTVDLSPSVDAEAMLGVPDLELEKIPYNCVECHCKLRGEMVVTGDIRLAALGASWTCCETCFGKKRDSLPKDTTFIHLKGCVNQRYAYHSYSLRVRNRMICYAPAQCVGEVNAQDQKVHYVTYAEVYNHARRLATTLQLVIGQEGVVCLRSENKAWWIAADAAICFGGFVCGPVATSVAPASMRKMIQLTDAKALLVTVEQFDAMVKCVCDPQDDQPLNSLKVVIVLGGDLPEKPSNWPNKIWLMGYLEAMKMGANIAPIKFSNDPQNDLRTLIFTSGSTGAPKAVMICDAQMTEEMDTVEQNAPSCSFCFEPLALAASRINTWRSLMNGGRIDMFSGNFSRFWDEVRDTKPHWFSATPRIWNWCYSNFKTRVDALEKEEGRSHEDALKMAKEEFSQMFGGRCRMVQTGSALTSPEVFAWMQSTFAPKMHVYDGYGSTEAGGIASNFKQDEKCIVHLQDMPELGYLTTDKPLARGLLWVHTPTIAMGYFRNEGQTTDSFKDINGDGRIFFNTGDIITYDAEKREIHVIDRAKNMFKLAQGCFVSPEALEGIYIGSPFVEQCFIYAEADREYVLAAVVVSESVLRHALPEEMHKSLSFAEICALPEAEDVVLKSLQELGRDRGVSAFEIPRAVLLEHVRWTPDTGTMTPSFKTNRIGLRAKYGPRLAQRYRRLEGGSLAESQGIIVDLTQSQLLNVVAGIAQPGARTQKVPTEEATFRSVLKRLTGHDCRQMSKSRLPDLGLDSVGMVQISSRCEKDLGVTLPYQLLYKSTLAEIEDYCEKAQQRRLFVSQGVDEAVNWEQECQLPLDLVTLLQASAKQGPLRVSPLNTFFLTGANGFLGIFLLQRLLAFSPDARVVALVRAANDDAALERLRQSATFHRVEHLDFARVQCVAGSLDKRLFGWDESRFGELADKVDAIVHNGCYVNGVLPYALLKDVNVGGTLECLRMSLSGTKKHDRRKRLIYVSSLSSLNPRERDEDSPLSVKGLNRMSGYGASKRVAEILLRRANVEHHYEVQVVRPGTISGSLHSGSCNPGDTITKLICGIAQLRAAPKMEEQLISLAPVEYVADVVVAVARYHQQPQQQNSFAVYNVFGTAISFEDVLHTMESVLSCAIKRVRIQEFVELIEHDPKNALAPLKSYFDGNNFPLQNDGDIVSENNTAKLRHACKLSVPVADAALVRKYVAFLKELNWMVLGE